MKKTLLNSAMLTVFSLLFFVTSFYALKPKQDSACLKINGIILKSPKEERGLYKVELLFSNTVMDSDTVFVNKPFEFILSRNCWYTLRITKEGFVPLLINVDTKLSPGNSTLYEFNFQTELYHKTDINDINRESINLPIGIVKFDPSNNRFYPIDDNKDQSIACLKINGLILKSPKGERGLYKVELFYNNSVIDSEMVSANKPFEFTLSKNCWYTIRISKEGFLPLLISVDTELSQDNSSHYEFNFQTELYNNGDIELYNQSDINYIDKDDLEIPIGLIRFEASNNRFYPINDYRGHITGSF